VKDRFWSVFIIIAFEEGEDESEGCVWFEIIEVNGI
jgi:hypothetical protein